MSVQVRDPDAALLYKQAWTDLAKRRRFAAPAFSASLLHVMPQVIVDAVAGFMSPAEGIELQTHDTAQRISRLLETDGTNILRQYPAACGAMLSLKYHEGRVFEDQPCLTFFVAHTDDARSIPAAVDGVPTDILVGGRAVLHSLGRHQPGERLSPAGGGASVSHIRVTSGTFGCLVRDADDVLYVLSCAHVLGDAQASVGDAVVHPGSTFGGTLPSDWIATFARSLPLHAGDCAADAAIARVRNPAAVDRQLRYIARPPRGTRELTSVGLLVRKSGDASGLTEGVVTGINGTVGPLTVNGVEGVYFRNVITTDGMSQSGDSGSLLVDRGSNALGLLFGGMDRPADFGGTVNVASWFSPINPVLNDLGVRLA